MLCRTSPALMSIICYRMSAPITASPSHLVDTAICVNSNSALFQLSTTDAIPQARRIDFFPSKKSSMQFILVQKRPRNDSGRLDLATRRQRDRMLPNRLMGMISY